jgi:dynein heavy chain
MSQGLWVVLENTHLAGDWMPSLCSLVQSLPSMRPHIDFRLWLTTVPSEEFPAVILQAALKLVMDPPAGIKANLMQVMSQLPQEVANAGRTSSKPQPSNAVLSRYLHYF